MRLSRALAWASGLFVLAVGGQLASCATLESIPTGVCGNDVKEANEDCDGTAPADRFDGGVGVCGTSGLGACRFLCGQHLDSEGDSALTVCPTDEVCSLEDSICRKDPATPSAKSLYQFEQLGASIPGNARSLTTGDFDGDGLGDVISLSTAETKLYLGSTKGLSLGFESELLMTGARAAKLTATPYVPDVRGIYAPGSKQDSTSDLTFVLDQGIAVVTGQSDATLTPAAYPKVDVPTPLIFAGITFGAPLNVKPAPTPWIFLPSQKLHGKNNLSGDICPEGQLALAYASTPPFSVHCFTQKTGVSNVVAAPLMSDLAAVCPQFVFAFNGDDKVTVYSPCEPLQPIFTPWVATGPKPTVLNISLDVGTVSWGPLVADVDGDGSLDIVVGVTTTNGDKIAVAFGDGQLNFHGKSGSSFAEEFATFVDPWEVYPHPDQIDSKVLAVGDINGDHRPDILTTKGLFVSSKIVTAGFDAIYHQVYRAASVANGSTFESGTFGDFNGDGLGDVAIALQLQTGTGSVGVPEVITLLGSSKHVDDIPLLDPYLVPTDAPTFHLVSGDFNGDGIDDIAFGQTTIKQTNPADAVDTITVIYGDPSASFSPVSMGQVKGISSLVTSDILAGGNEPFYDGDSDLGVLSSFTDQSGPHNNAAILDGRPGHLMIAPLGLERLQGTNLHQAQTLAVASGRFQSPDRYDLGALAVDIDPSGITQDELNLWRTPLGDNAVAGLSSFVPVKGSYNSLAPTTSTVLASAATYPLHGGSTDWLIALIVSIPEDPRIQPTARIYSGEPANSAFTPNEFEFNPPPPDPLIGARARVEAANLGKGPVVVVLVNGRLYTVSKPTTSLEPKELVESGVVDFAILQRPASDQSLIVYLTDGGEVSMSDGEGTFHVSGIHPVLGPLAIGVGDFDGDRLPDIVIGSAGALTAYRMTTP